MPDIDGLELIIDYLAELNWAKRGFSGLDPLDPIDISQWLDVVEFDLPPFVKMLLVRLSRQYAHQANISGDDGCPQPYEFQLSEEDESRIRDAAERELMARF